MINHFGCLFLLAILAQSCSTTNYLASSASAHVLTDQETFLTFQYKEKLNELGHNFEPWETTTYDGVGDFWINTNTFLKRDTLVNSRGRKYTSMIDYDGTTFLYLDYGDEELLPITQDMFYEKVINTARYTPTIILQYFIQHKEKSIVEIVEGNAVYSIAIGNYNVELFINTTNQQVAEIAYLSYDELYGDVTTSFIYSSYKKEGMIAYPTVVRIEKINGMVVDTVEILDAKITSNDFKLLEKPDDYQLAQEKGASEPEVIVSAYNDYIHFIDLKHTDDKIMVVEFDDYMLVAEAPVNANNGELIIAEVRKIAPEKPIRYFVFGHHHPHYLGGLRAFVHKEATILCTDISKDYVAYIASAPHTLQPDSLQLESAMLKTQIIRDSLVLGGENPMAIYFIGDKSAHTKDYLLYYFPKDKLLFQDDLCWIPAEGAITKASARQVGLYNSIKALNIEVETIIQSWPVSSHKIKTIIPFADLEKSIELTRE